MMLEELEHYILPSLHYDFGLLWLKKEELGKAKNSFEKAREMFEEMGDDKQVKKCQDELDRLEQS